MVRNVSGGAVVGVVLLGLAYFAVLMLVVVDRPRPGSTRGRHRRDQPEGAR